VIGRGKLHPAYQNPFIATKKRKEIERNGERLHSSLAQGRRKTTETRTKTTDDHLSIECPFLYLEKKEKIWSPSVASRATNGKGGNVKKKSQKACCSGSMGNGVCYSGGKSR